MHLKITDIEKQPDELWIQPSTIGSEFLVPKATGVRGEEWLVLSAAIATAAERAPALLSLRQEPVKASDTDDVIPSTELEKTNRSTNITWDCCPNRAYGTLTLLIAQQKRAPARHATA